MAREITPTIRRWQLGQLLQQAREAADVEQKAAAKEIGVSAVSVSRIENGKQSIKAPYVKLLSLLYGLDEAQRDTLLTMAEEAGQPEWYVALARRAPNWFKQYLGYESVATSIQVYESELVHGLLQTERYTRCMIPAGRVSITAAELDHTIELRQQRQIRTSTDGVELHVVLNEAVLRRMVGGPDIMREQLLHIVQRSELPDITVQVLPFAAGEHASMTSPFALLGLRDYPGMNTVYLENGRGALYLEAPADLAQYEWRFGRLVETALPPDQSRKVLASVARDL